MNPLFFTTVCVMAGVSFKTIRHTYRPRSAIRPSLTTRIWSAPMMVDSLLQCNNGPTTHQWKKWEEITELKKKPEGTWIYLPVSYNHCSTIGTDFGQRGLDVALCLCVQGRCGLQRDNIRKLQLTAMSLHVRWQFSRIPHPAGWFVVLWGSFWR